MAIVLAADHFLRRGEHAVANGWFQRAHHLLEGHDPCAEHAMLSIWESYVAVVFRHDTATARQLGTRRVLWLVSLGEIDLEMLAQASLGFATVCEGEVELGMRLLDEATAAAVAGEMSDPDAIVTTCCYLISACERVRDYDRAAQWCERAIALSARWSYRFMFAYCRTHYAGVLMWRGAWSEAETELEAATGELGATFPAMAAEGIARLAELRRRQGRAEEAHALLARLDTHPLRAMGSRLAMLGRAALALDRGDSSAAIDLAERYLRSVPVRGSGGAGRRVGSAPAGTGRARRRAHRGNAAIAGRDHDGPSPRRRCARRATSPRASSPLPAVSYDEARRRFEDAVDLFDQSAAPYDAARARLELGSVLAAMGRPEAAARETRAAVVALDQIGAVQEHERAGALLRRLESAGDDRAGTWQVPAPVA